VQFSNGVSVNTHKGFTLEIDHGAYPWWRSVGFLIPFGRSWTSGSLCIRGLLGFQKGASEQVYVHEDTLEGFWSMITGEA
jgi:hypothetical protein